MTVRLRGATEPTPFVTAVDYDARGQRVRVAFGNGAESASSYDPLTRRLAALRTDASDRSRRHRVAAVRGPDGRPGPALHVRPLRQHHQDRGRGRCRPSCRRAGGRAGAHLYLRRGVPRDRGDRARAHRPDATRSRCRAGGRRDFPFAGAHPNDLQALRNYTERYEYDDVGNLTQLRHLVDGNGWNRQYEYADSPLQPDHSSNRLTRTTVANGTAVAEDYRYTDAAGTDVAGCITAINAMGFAWDHKRRLARADLGGGGTAHIRYDIADQRVRKVVESSAGVRRTERIWFEGFEISRDTARRETTSSATRDAARLRGRRSGRAGGDADDRRRRACRRSSDARGAYQVADHLDSATVELDGTGALIGARGVPPVRHDLVPGRAQRDRGEPAPLPVHRQGTRRGDGLELLRRARYYAPWLGRWCSPDPLGIVDGTNVYVYARNNPLVYVDTAGTDVKKVVRTDNFHELLRQAISEVEKKTISKEAADKQYAKYAKSTALGSAISAATDPIGKKFQEKVQLLGRVTTKLGFSPPGWEEAHGNPEACFKLACARCGPDQSAG